ncbi:hypothetical protein [Bradyrhizobium sp. IAR9]|uniref:hypothetical protein n=2 Tax=unclassified Bradyrhizobium TaxID=2631580 RepID=UPI001FEFE2D2|nr:hypothetical protein [Bradyrhizobium sp. IAR9]
MLQIDHRISHDVDIFLPDPQVLPFLDPQKHDFDFEVRPTDYRGDGARLLKLGFEFGEIDFIVAPSLTSHRQREQQLKAKRCCWRRSQRSLQRKSITGARALPRATYLTSQLAATNTRNRLSGSWPAIATASQIRWPQSKT